MNDSTLNAPITDDSPPSLWLGIEQFNQREFYACHDTLEAIWMDAKSSEKNFYQGILQIAVALYHLGNHNWKGCVILMGEGIHRLRGFLPHYEDVDVQGLVIHTSQLLQAIQESGADHVGAIAQQLERGENSLTYPVICRYSESTSSSDA
ncbi:MAG: DUF309 domain-containing protein [Leptolyngbyaceae bacterium]|nr:DUF309 domain-containing protein [Leptolyngbyaceae bacterium]